MPIDTTWSFPNQADANEDWILSSDVTDGGGADHEAQAASNNNGGWWCWTNTGSPSSSTGPPSGEACIYTETSSSGAGSPAAGDEFTCELRVAINAGLYNINVTFDRCTYGNTAGIMYFEAWDGLDWNEIDSWIGDGTTTFTSEGPYDLSAYDNADFKVRFRTVIGGTVYQNDFSVDEIRIYGTDKVTYEITGITKDKDGDILGSCEVFLCIDNGDDTATFLAHTTSNASTGVYTFSGPYGTADHFVIAWKDDTPHVFDCTDHVLQGTEE